MTAQTEPVPHQYIKTRRPQVRFDSALRLWGLVVLSLHLAAFNLPEEAAWSLWPYTLLPTWLGWLLALLAGALIIPAVNTALSRVVQRLWPAWPVPSARQRWFALAALLAGLIFWLARLRHLRWGDSYMLSVLLSYPDLDIRVVYNWQAPLTVFLHQRLWQLIADPLFGWPVEQVYAAVSIICGVIFVYLLLTFMVRLGRDPLETAILTGLMLTTGSIQLFFGYVENYTIVSLLLLATLFLAWKSLHGELQPVWPVFALAIANAFHPSTVFLWPGIGLLSTLCWKRGRISPVNAMMQTIVPPLLVGGAVFALMESGSHGVSALLGVDRPGGGDGIWFVPLFETSTEWQQYTMFSQAHLLDWLNLHFLISPFGMPIMILALMTTYRLHVTIFDSGPERDYFYFLGLTSLMYLLFTWLWNPDYGGRKDWDLFAPSAFVYTLLAGYMLVRILTGRRRLKATGLFVIFVSLLHTAAWIFANTHNLPHD